MEDNFIHSSYVSWRVGGVEIQLWPPAWWPLAIVGLALLVAVAVAVVLVPRVMHSNAAKRDDRS